MVFGCVDNEYDDWDGATLYLPITNCQCNSMRANPKCEAEKKLSRLLLLEEKAKDLLKDRANNTCCACCMCFDEHVLGDKTSHSYVLF